MSVKLQQLAVRNLGPLAELNLNLKSLNLFFGSNESGKTFLVEFLVQSLFRSARSWPLRDHSGGGSVTLQGLEPEAVEFTPDRGLKLEDYWEAASTGFPNSLARLLVVRAGDLSLDPGSGIPSNRTALRSLLTQQPLIDTIRSHIPATIQKAEITNGEIIGRRQGQIKELELAEDRLRSMEVLLDDIDKKYTRGPLRQTELKIETSQAQLDLLLQAKKHQAYQHHLSLKTLDEKRQRLSDTNLNQLRDRVRDHQRRQGSLADHLNQIEDNHEQVQLFNWTRAAARSWMEGELDRKAQPPSWLGYLSAAALVVSLGLLALAMLDPPQLPAWPGLVLTGLGISLSIFYTASLQRWSAGLSGYQERVQIQDDFESRFGSRPHSLADILQMQAQLESFSARENALETDAAALRKTLERESIQTESLFQEMLDEVPGEEEWDDTVRKLRQDRTELDRLHAELLLALGQLDIPERDYLSEPQEVDYDPQTEQALVDELAELQETAAGHQKELRNLKLRACEWTGDDLDKPWNEVFYHLNNQRMDLVEEIQALRAEISAKIGLSNVIDRLESEELEKINQVLAGPETCSLLKKITGRYTSAALDGDTLKIRDDFRGYSISNLSTGAQDQVLLALRLGLASYICAGKPLFLVLDDAFQHADWPRRQNLVLSTISLVEAGWQVMYLTMDDHLRDLFREYSQPVLEDRFLFHDLDLENPSTS